jgi:hypothetical protein
VTDHEGRRRRLADVRTEVEAPPATDHPALQRLAARAGGVDREERFSQRLDVVTSDHARRLRRVALAKWVLWVSLVLAGAGVGWSGLLPGTTAGTVAAAAAGGAVGLAGAFVQAASGPLARRRGARAWDWTVGRHRLVGDPSAEVQSSDQPGGAGIRTGDPRRRG